MHISQGIVIAMHYLPSLNLIEFFLVVSFPFFIDFDFLFSKYAKDNNHRRLITHSLFPYLALLPLGLFYQVLFILGLCGIIHILTDTVDWGTSLFSPIIKEPLGGILPTPPKEVVEIPNYKKRQCWFTKVYYASSIIVVLEIFFGGLAILSILLIDLTYFWIMLFYFVFLMLQIRFYLMCTKKG
ncbi:MAG: hypothetical protein ACTSRS_03785 [Candidatus Helarchaeota archaeon]